MPYLLVQEPAIVERRRSRVAGFTAGSMNRIDNCAFEWNTGCTTRGRGRTRKRNLEATAPNLVLTATRKTLHSPTSRLKMILKVLQVLYFNSLVVNKSNTRDILSWSGRI